MRLALTALFSLVLCLTGCGDNKGKVEKGGEVAPDPNIKTKTLSAPKPSGPTPTKKTKIK